MEIIYYYIIGAVIFLIGIGFVIFKPHDTNKSQSHHLGGGGSSGGGSSGGGSGGGGSGGGGDGGDSDNKNTWVNAHNKYRTARQLPPMKWDNLLASQASTWSNKLKNQSVLSHGDMAHANCEHNKCGQNISGGLIDEGIDHVVQSWVTCECPSFTGGPPPMPPAAGHYSQVMWPTATKVGCDVAGQIAVCNYNTGNVIEDGSYTEKVPQGNCGEIPSFCKRGTYK